MGRRREVASEVVSESPARIKLSGAQKRAQQRAKLDIGDAKESIKPLLNSIRDRVIAGTLEHPSDQIDPTLFPTWLNDLLGISDTVNKAHKILSGDTTDANGDSGNSTD